MPRNENPSGLWTMHVRLDDQLLAVHDIAWYPVGVEEEPEDSFLYPHAQEAARAAGGMLNSNKIMLTDIGLLVRRHNGDTQIYRTEDIPENAVSLQPFIRLSLESKAVGALRFELVDNHDRVLLTYEEQHQFDRGDNLISARTLLPLDGNFVLSGGWGIRVYIGDTLAAWHPFGWRDNTLRNAPLDSDGEVSKRLEMEVVNRKGERVSLDELLNPPRRRRR
jgi:hypothetical protein